MKWRVRGDGGAKGGEGGSAPTTFDVKSLDTGSGNLNDVAVSDAGTSLVSDFFSHLSCGLT